MWEVILSNLPQILTAVIAIGFIWKYGSKALAVIKELEELLAAILLAAADKKFTQEELDKIVKEAKDVPDAVKKLLGKD